MVRCRTQILEEELALAVVQCTIGSLNPLNYRRIGGKRVFGRRTSADDENRQVGINHHLGGVIGTIEF